MLSLTDFLLRLSLACLCGAAIGFERQKRDKSAGLRTNSLVAIGSAIYVLISIQITEGDAIADVTRIIGQVVTGIGFLGAGVILQKGTSVLGLTTAATVWCSSAIGCMVGAGYYLEAVICTVFIIFINVGLIMIYELFDRKEGDGV